MWDLLQMKSLLMRNNYYDYMVVIVVSITTSFLISKAWKSSTQKNGHIPGHLGFPFIGETLSFLSAINSYKGCYDFVRQRRLRHGNWFKTRLFGKTIVFIPTPEGAKSVLANDFNGFNKGYLKSMADAVGEKSLLRVPLESHKRIRRLIANPFSMNAMSKFVKRVDKMILERLKDMEDRGQSFRVLEFSMKVTFDAMCEILMSVTDTNLLQEIERYCDDVSNMMLCIPVMIPGTSYYKGIKARKKLMGIFSEMISRRQSGLEDQDDILQSMLVRDSFKENEKLDDTEIMDNLLTLIIAGQSTTAAAIMWSVKFLDGNKFALEKLREEQLPISRSKSREELLTLEDLNRMPYGSKVVKETLRMSNVLLWFPRVVEKDCIIEGYRIKKGWNVNVDVTQIHYNPQIYKDPLEFNPSRFDEMQKPYTFLPFGSGVRTCIGHNMAKVTMLVFLHRLTSTYKWNVDDLDSSLERKTHVPRLRNGCPITLNPLKNGESIYEC